MILYLFFGFILGVWIGSYFWVSATLVLTFFVLSLFLFLYTFFIPKENRKVLYVICIFIVGSLLGFSRVYFSDLYKMSELTFYEDKKVFADGLVVDEPDVRENSTRLTVRLFSIYDGVSTSTVNEKIIAVVPIYPEFDYGDKVYLSINLKRPEAFDTDTGRVFNYPGYLRARGIWYTAPFSEISLISKGHGNFIRRNLFSLKRAFTNSMERAIPAPESSLLAGLLLGAKTSLGKELLDSFNRVGVSHIVVLSGFNIAVVAKSIMAVLYFLPKRAAFFSGATSIVLFIMLAGGGMASIRAGIMILLILSLERINRQHDSAKVLLLTIVAMILWNPVILAFDPGFNLSVLATAGLIFVSPVLSQRLLFITERFGLREIISATVSAQIMVLPYLLYAMGVLSFVSLPANILILAFVPLTMFLGFVTGALGLLSSYLSFVPGFLTYIFLKYELLVVKALDSVPFGIINLPVFSYLWVVAIYLLMAWFLYKKN